MKDITREYMTFFNMQARQAERLEKSLTAMIAAFNDPEVEALMNKVVDAVDFTLLETEMAKLLESLFNEEDMRQLLDLHKANPVLMKYITMESEMMAAEQALGTLIVEDAMQRSGFKEALGQLQ